MTGRSRLWWTTSTSAAWSDKVLVMTYGEFGRTPRINTTAGRDHWPGAASVVFAGGGLPMGQVIGADECAGGISKLAPASPQDVLATMYQVLGINYRHEFIDGGQRPIPILNEGRPIQELF